MGQDRFLAAGLAVLAVLARVVTAGADSSLALLLEAAGVAAGLAVVGLGLLRALAFPGRGTALWGAAPVMGLACAVVLANLPLLFGLGEAAQTMALLVGLLGLGLAGILAPSGDAAPVKKPRKGIPPPPVDGPWLALGALLAGLLAAWLPIARFGAWSVAGHDLDTLQHQDGALHVVITILAGEGVRSAPGYPLGLHALMSGLSGVLAVDAFHVFAVVLLVLPGMAAASAVWAASACGSAPRGAFLAGLLVAVHPLLLFTGMEQFAPQLAATALVPAALAAAVVGHDASPRSVGLLAVVLAALLSVYGLALAVAAPVVALGALRAPFVPSVKRLSVAVALALCLAPLGTLRLVQRLGGGEDAPPSPVKSAGKLDAPPSATSVLSPDVHDMGREATSALSWQVTAAHVAGLSPYRDHFLRTARIIQAGLGKEVGESSRPLLVMWAAGVVPAVTFLLLVLVLLGVGLRIASGSVAMGLGMLAALVAAGGAVWLGAGTGIKPYYGFKLASLSAGLLMVAVAQALEWVRGRLPGGVGTALVLGVLLTRAPAVLAVEVEYTRALALDRDFVRVMGPTLSATFRRSARAEDASPTRRYWESRLLLARAREVGSAAGAEILLCTAGRTCPLEDSGRLILRSGAYSLWARR